MDRLRQFQNGEYLRGERDREEIWGEGCEGVERASGDDRYGVGEAYVNHPPFSKSRCKSVLTIVYRTQEDWDMYGEENIKRLMATTFKSPSQGAATTVWAAMSPHFEGKNGGQYLEDVGESQPAEGELQTGTAGYSPHAYDQEKEDMLWKLSSEIVGVKHE